MLFSFDKVLEHWLSMLTSSHPPTAQFEYRASEGPNINTFYSGSHRGELRPHHQSSQSELL